MQKKVLTIQKVQQRPGEGHPVDFVVENADGESLRGSLDISGLPVPDRRFACDAVSLLFEPDRARVLLGQRQPIGDDLLSMLVVNMSSDSVAQFLQSVPETFTSKNRQGGPVPDAAKLVTFKANAQQSVVLTSSLLMAGYTGQSACVDFYFGSPFSVLAMATLRKMSLEPVVRVNLTTGNLFALIDGLREAAPKFGWDKL